jgi:uncharacterized membrane protein YecN with MAPEG domain
MIFPGITAFYAAILGLIYVALTGLVVFGRGKFKVFNGDGGNQTMHQMIRAHANFNEYVPLLLVLIGFLEAGGGSPSMVRTMLIVLVIARALHPFGMLAREKTLQQMICRGFSSLATWIILIVVSILLLTR